VIDLDGLRVTRGGVPVLDDVSLSVGEGEFVGLVGPNGAGKTTLLQTVNGVLDPDAGTVSVGGTAVHDASAREVGRLVATVPQHASVGFDFAVEDIVAMGRTPYHSRFGGGDYAEDRRHVERALEKTETADFADRSIDAVSGGERQRVLLARALAQDTPVLLLDEPTASLDINHQVETLSLVADLVAEGKTAVAAIHDLDLAARFCDRLVLVADGGVLADGTPEAVLRGDLLDDAFAVDAAVATDTVTGTPTVTAFDDRPDRDLHAHVLGSGTLAARTVARLGDGGVTVTLGPVPDGDVAVETARARDLDAVTVPPLSPPDDAAHERARDLAAAADVVVLADPPGGVDRRRLLGDGRPVVRVGPDSVTGPGNSRVDAATVETVLAEVVTTAAEREVSADD
jgi:iron complex transport system ATP-binding protein